jgi:membrane-associated protease RseP (regulator of RpoE activity)
MNPKEPISIWKRIAGIFFGGVAGLVLGVILFLILDVCGVVMGKDRIFTRFAIGGAGVGAVLGAIFPRPLIAVGYFLGQLIPGI